MNFDKLGISKEDIEKYSEIKDSFKFEELKTGDSVVMEILEDEIKEIDTISKQDNDDKGIKKGDKLKVPIMVVKVHYVETKEGDKDLYPENNEYTLWLSAKTLSLGLASIIINKKKDEVVGLKFRVTKDKAKFAKGSNNCYRVVEVTDLNKEIEQ